jgi:glycosyltransferase involved in cell wall biosynthesis
MSPVPIRVLVLHASAAFGGASKSLVELLGGIARENLSVTVLVPRGAVAERFRGAGMEVVEVAGLSQFDNTRISFYRGLRWIVVLREIAFLPATLLALWRLRHRAFDLIHANEITLAPAGVLAKIILRRPLVVHVRSLQRSATRQRTRWLFGLVRRHADAVVAIDEGVRRSLPSDVPARVIHNTLSLRGNSPAPVPAARMRVGFVGNFLPFKGIHEFMQAARLCRDRGLPVEFIIAGDNPRSVSGVSGWLLGLLGFARDVRSELAQFVKKERLEHMVRFTGFVDDVASIYTQLDVLCFTTHLDAPGRPVIEAAFFGVPSIVAVRDPQPDTIVHNETGICIDSPDPVRLADAIEHLQRNPAERVRLGEGARRLAHRNFDRSQNAAAMLALYHEVVGRERQ